MVNGGEKGVSLIEVAVTVLILSTSLLALATLQSRSLQFNQGAAFRTQANIFAYDIADRIRINRGTLSANISGYTADFGGTPTGNTLAVSDVADWRAAMSAALPSGEGKISCDDTTKVCSITVRWSEENIFGVYNSSTNIEARSSLTYATRI